jgi:hypothetical protein
MNRLYAATDIYLSDYQLPVVIQGEISGGASPNAKSSQRRLAPIFHSKCITAASKCAVPPSKKRKTKSDPHIASVPSWVDLAEILSCTGRPADLLLRRLAVLCYDPSDVDQTPRLRCSGSVKGCPFSWVVPRNKSRIYKHASACAFVDLTLREEASEALSADAPSVHAEEQLGLVHSLPSNARPALVSDPTLHSLATNLGREQLKALVDFAIVRFICDCGIPPYCVDRESFRALLSHLNSRYTVVSFELSLYCCLIIYTRPQLHPSGGSSCHPKKHQTPQARGEPIPHTGWRLYSTLTLGLYIPCGYPWTANLSHARRGYLDSAAYR